MKVAIIGGTGDLGFGLAVRLGAADVEVVIGSRDATRAEGAAARVPSGATGAANADALVGADLIVLAVPFAAHASTLGGIKDALTEGQVVVDATVPLATAVGGKPTRTIEVWAGSAAQQAQEILGKRVHVVSALHTISAASLADLGHELNEDVLICGDRTEDKERVFDLIRRIPVLRPVDAGRLEMSRVVEQLTALLISINIRHKAHAGIKITGLET